MVQSRPFHLFILVPTGESLYFSSAARSFASPGPSEDGEVLFHEHSAARRMLAVLCDAQAPRVADSLQEAAGFEKGTREFFSPFFWAAQDLFHSAGESTLGLDGSHFASLVLKGTPTQSSKHILGRLFFGSTDQLARPSDIHFVSVFSGTFS